MEKKTFYYNQMELLDQIRNLNIVSDGNDDTEILSDLIFGPLMCFIEDVAFSFIGNNNEYSIEKIINRTIETVQIILTNGNPNVKTVLNNKQTLLQVISKLTDTLLNQNQQSKTCKMENLDYIHKKFSMLNLDSKKTPGKNLAEVHKDSSILHMNRRNSKLNSIEIDEQIQLTKSKKSSNDVNRTLMRHDGLSHLSYLDVHPERYVTISQLDGQNERKETRNQSKELIGTVPNYKRPSHNNPLYHSFETQFKSSLEPIKSQYDFSENSKVNDESKILNDHVEHFTELPLNELISYVDKIKRDSNMKWSTQAFRNTQLNSSIYPSTSDKLGSFKRVDKKENSLNYIESLINDSIKTALRNNKNYTFTENDECDDDDDEDNDVDTDELMRVCKKYLSKRNKTICTNLGTPKTCNKNSTKNCIIHCPNKHTAIICDTKCCCCCSNYTPNLQYIICNQPMSNNHVSSKVDPCNMPIIKNNSKVQKSSQTNYYQNYHPLNHENKSQNNRIQSRKPESSLDKDFQLKNQQSHENPDTTKPSDHMKQGNIIINEQAEKKSLVKTKVNLLNHSKSSKLITGDADNNPKLGLAEQEINADLQSKYDENPKETNGIGKLFSMKKSTYSFTAPLSIDDVEPKQDIPSNISPSFAELLTQYTHDVIINKKFKNESKITDTSRFLQNSTSNSTSSNDKFPNDKSQSLNGIIPQKYSTEDNNDKINESSSNSDTRDCGCNSVYSTQVMYQNIPNVDSIEHKTSLTEKDMNYTPNKLSYNKIETQSKSLIPSITPNMNGPDLSNQNLKTNSQLLFKQNPMKISNKNPVKNEDKACSTIDFEKTSNRYIQHNNVKSMPQYDKEPLKNSNSSTEDDEDDSNCNIDLTILPVNCHCTNCVSTIFNSSQQYGFSHFQKCNLGFFHNICSQPNNQIGHQCAHCCDLTVEQCKIPYIDNNC